MSGLSNVSYTPYGKQHTIKAVSKATAAAAASAQSALDLLGSDLPNVGVPGNWGTTKSYTRVSSRLMFNGHPSISDRPGFHSILRMGSMSERRQTATGYWALYGKRSLLDSFKPMYRRANGSLIVQDGPPIWRMVEYGTGRHSITPRADRKWMRFYWSSHNWAKTYAQKVKHPGAFRNMGVGGRISMMLTMGASASGLGFWQRTRNIIRADEPYGAAPFRLSLIAVQRLAPTIYREALMAQGLPL